MSTGPRLFTFAWYAPLLAFTRRFEAVCKGCRSQSPSNSKRAARPIQCPAGPSTTNHMFKRVQISAENGHVATFCEVRSPLCSTGCRRLQFATVFILLRLLSTCLQFPGDVQVALRYVVAVPLTLTASWTRTSRYSGRGDDHEGRGPIASQCICMDTLLRCGLRLREPRALWKLEGSTVHVAFDDRCVAGLLFALQNSRDMLAPDTSNMAVADAAMIAVLWGPLATAALVKTHRQPHLLYTIIIRTVH